MNYPNPFNSSTKIAFYIPQVSQVVIKIYNIQGEFIQELVNQKLETGDHVVNFDASNLSSGIYLCKFEASYQNNSKPYSAVQKLLLLK